MEASKIKVVVDKRQLLDELRHVRTVMREYEDVLRSELQGEQWERVALELAQAHEAFLAQVKGSLRSVELAQAVVEEALRHLPGETLTLPAPDGAPGNGRPPARPARRPDGSLTQLVAELQGLVRHAPLALQEKVRLLLLSVSTLFRALQEQDRARVEDCMNQIHLLTSSRESQNLIREIAVIARDIYESLNAFSHDLPLTDLSESAEGMSEAVRKLRSVITRLEAAANQNLDTLETTVQGVRASRESVNGVFQGLRSVQHTLGEVRLGHPGVSERVARLQDRLGDGIGAPMMELQPRLESNLESYVSMMSNQSFQDLTGQTLGRIIAFIERLELELVGLVEKYRPVLGLTGPRKAPALEQEPPAREVRQSQDQVDALLNDLGF